MDLFVVVVAVSAVLVLERTQLTFTKLRLSILGKGSENGKCFFD